MFNGRAANMKINRTVIKQQRKTLKILSGQASAQEVILLAAHVNCNICFERSDVAAAVNIV